MSKENKEISAKELLAMLKSDIGEEHFRDNEVSVPEDDADEIKPARTGSVYHFKRSKKSDLAARTDVILDGFVRETPQKKTDFYLTDEEVQALLKKYASDDEGDTAAETENVVKAASDTAEADAQPVEEIETAIDAVEEAIEEIAEPAEAIEELSEVDADANDDQIDFELVEYSEETIAEEAEEENVQLADAEAEDVEASEPAPVSDIDISERIKDAENYVAQFADEDEDEANAEELPMGAAINDEFDETDVNLMIAFGMEDELKKTVGAEKANEIEENVNRSSEMYSETEEKTEPETKEEEAFEYTSATQNKEIFKKYKIDYRKCILRLGACAILLILSFFYENMAIFGATLPGAFNPATYPVVHIMIDLQILIFAALLIYKQIITGFKALVALNPVPESVTTMLLAFSALYHLVACFFGISATVVMYNFPLIMCIFLAILAEFLNLRREIMTFNVISSKRVKYALAKLDPESAPLETEAFSEVLPEDPSIFKISKTSFVEGFYGRMRKESSNKKVLKTILPLTIAISVVIFVVALIVTGSFSKSVTVAQAALMLAVPFSTYMIYSLPMYNASKVTFESESAIIGEAAIDEYAAASSVSFEDRDVFPSYGVKVKSVKVFGKNRIDRIIYYAASLFSAAGGPLRDVFDIATMDSGRSDDVELLNVAYDGLEALVDGTHVFVGKANYLKANGYAPVSDASDEEIENGGEISITYIVVDNEVSAKLYIQYRLDPDFEFILKKLYKAGVCVGIKTLDPNIDDEMLGRRIKTDKYPVKVLKCREASEASGKVESIESGIVSRNSTKSLLQTFALCDKVHHITKTNSLISFFAIFISIIISAFVVIFGMTSGVHSVYVALYQLFWIIPMFIISKVFI